MALFSSFVVMLLVICWAAGFFAFHQGPIVHILLVVAVLVIILRLIQRRRNA